MAVQNLTTTDFEEKTKKGVSLVDFWAPWCGPCRMLTPVIEELEKDFGDRATIGKVNVDEEGELAQKYEIRSIPAVFVMKDGKVDEIHVGVKSKAEYATSLESALSN